MHMLFSHLLMYSNFLWYVLIKIAMSAVLEYFTEAC